MDARLLRRQAELPRDLAERSQRERMLRAMVRSVGEAVEEAKVSRSTFYEEFRDKERCVMEACDWMMERVLAQVAEAYQAGAESSWPQGIRNGLEALLDAIAEQPRAARMAMVEVPPIGPEARERHRVAVARLVPLIRDGRDYVEEPEELPDQVELMALGGAESILFEEIASGRSEQLPALLPGILFAILVPFLGPEDAAAEMQAAATPLASRSAGPQR
jgi:AcrR family transcriptional regulator